LTVKGGFLFKKLLTVFNRDLVIIGMDFGKSQKAVTRVSSAWVASISIFLGIMSR